VKNWPEVFKLALNTVGPGCGSPKLCIEDGISIRTRFGECLAQLLDHPLCRRVLSHIEMQYPAPPVPDHEKAVEQLECHRRRRERVERRNHLAMMRQRKVGGVISGGKIEPS
jgi:hypothetical protein